ncbi:unnamed protein product [Cochlearia groenlandica]
MGRTNLAPGFRFHPTDVELVRYYLRRKVMGKNFLTNAITEIDIYKFEPPDLPDKSCLNTGDLKWYFFCPREKKYSKSAKAKRSTKAGYWKTTGRDRDVSYNNEVVGKIRTLIFHIGKTHRGDRTDWVMHEYRLEDKVLAQKNVPQDTYVLCVLFKKNGPGPRHGSQYGAPFKEEEWSDEGEEDTKNLVAISSAKNSDPGPSKETSLVATTSHSQAPQGCFNGVISESCVANVPPLDSTVVPPLTSDIADHTPMPSSSPPLLHEVPQAPLQDEDDLYSMLDLFAVENDESLLFNGFNNQNEAGLIDCFCSIQVRPESSVPVVEETLGFLQDGEFSGTQDLSYDLFIDLMDLIEPSTPPPAQAGCHGDSRSNNQS